MTGRDRIVIIAVAVLAMLAGGWILVVSPERKQASKLASEVSAAQAQLSTAEGQLSNARAAQSQYAAAYSSVVSLGKAVPAEPEVPSLIYQLAHATNQTQVDFNSITSGAGSTSTTASAAAKALAAPAGFTPMPFTFVFDGGFFDLEHLFSHLTSFTTVSSAGTLNVSGRLLTVQSIKLAPVETSAGPGTKPTRTLSGTITATAYQLPATQGLTGSATAASPSGAATPAASISAAGASRRTQSPARKRLSSSVAVPGRSA